jgi:multiple antibiotic resistance protein
LLLDSFGSSFERLLAAITDRLRRPSALLLWTTFLLAFSALLPIINPVGSALIFLGVVGDAPPAVFRPLARRIAINNIIFLAVIELIGSSILRFFGISLPVIQLAGGLVITSIGWTLLNQKDADVTTHDKQEEADANDDKSKALAGKSFYPFTFPITSGPGTLVVILTLSAHVSRATPLDYGLSHGGVFLAIVVISILCYFCYAYAPRLTRAVAPGTVHGILRVMAFIVLSIGVQIMWNGFRTLYSQLPPR